MGKISEKIKEICKFFKKEPKILDIEKYHPKEDDIFIVRIDKIERFDKNKEIFKIIRDNIKPAKALIIDNTIDISKLKYEEFARKFS